MRDTKARLQKPEAIALAGLAALAVAMGIGRFAFTPLLPMMQADAGVTLAQGGWLASANYAGYLAGALWAAAQPVRAAPAIRLGLLAIGLSTAAMGLSGNLSIWLFLRAVAGIASAWVLVHVSSWCLERLAQLGRPLLNGTVYAGVGTGIFVAGILCVSFMRFDLSSSEAWIALGAASLVACAMLWPVFDSSSSAARAAGGKLGWDREAIRLVACYGAYGFGYIIPATYLPVMARSSIENPTLFGWAWPLLGAVAAASTLAVAPLQGRLNNRHVWVLAHLVMALGVAAPLLFRGLAGILIAAVCVGSGFVVVTLVGMQEARRVAGREAARLMAAMTAAFAAGQILGPLFVAAVAGAGGSLAAAMAAASLVLIGSAGALLRRRD
jgi:predicted MFS family arabinose efflux permease